MRRRVLQVVAALFGVLLLLTVMVSVVLVRDAVEIAISMQRSAMARDLPRSTVEGPLGPITIFEGGEGPLLVFLHGFMDQSGGWHFALVPLLDEHRVIAIDLPGHGESAPEDGDLDLWDMVAAVDAVIAARAQGERPVIVGNSMGGWTALTWAHQHPGAAERVVLLNAAGMRHPIDRDLLIPTSRDAVRAKNTALLGPEHDMDLPGFLLDQLSDRMNTPAYQRLYDNLTDGEHYMDPWLAEHTEPVELIWGTDDGFFPLDYAQRLDAALPASRLHTLEHCGHAPQITCPDELAATLTEVLAMKPPELVQPPEASAPQTPEGPP